MRRLGLALLASTMLVGAAAAADNVTVTVEPTAAENGDFGELFTPAGNPLIATLTFPVKP